MGDIVEFLQNRQTGPRTALGKRRSSRNALRTGIYSQAVVIRGLESQEEFDALVRSVVAYHDIEDPVVMLSAERFVAIAWRLRRVRRVEAEKLSRDAVEYGKASSKLESLRDELRCLIAWQEVAQQIRFSTGQLSHDVIEKFRTGVEYLFATSDLSSQGITQRVEFDSNHLGRIDLAGKPVRRSTANRALEDARKTLPAGLARDSLPGFLAAIAHALEMRVLQQKTSIEEQERAVLGAFIGSLELDWQSERSISDAERRLDLQFTRALTDFHNARRASAEQESFPTKHVNENR